MKNTLLALSNLNNMSEITRLRQQYQQAVCAEAIFLKRGAIPSIADVGSSLSTILAQRMFNELSLPLSTGEIKGQTAGKRFEELTRDFVAQAFDLLAHLRPGNWQFTVQGNIADFVQYRHLAELNALVQTNKALRTALGDYVVKPDVIVARTPVTDSQINQHAQLVAPDNHPRFTPLRTRNQLQATSILHARISCKLTLRSDRSQNARTEALNLIRNRKGHTPHIAVVTAEPMPTRLASLALGTGDIDCVYHFALPELVRAANWTNNEAVIEQLNTMIEGNRLRDVADLPFDLAI